MKELIKHHVGFHQDENFVPTKCLKRVCISNMPYDRIARFSIKTLLYNTILWIILIAIIPLDHRGMIYQFCGNKIPLVGATMSTTMTCTGSTSFVNEIAKSSFVSARNSPSPVKFKFLRRSYVPYLPLKVIITTDNGPNITSFFLQAHEQGKTTPIGNFNSTFSDKDISIIGCGVNTVKFKNTATTVTGKYRKRSKVTLYWNPPANFKTAIQFRVNVFTTDRPTRGWRGLTSEEIVPRVAECYTGNGASYRGTMSHTKSGIYCQKWDSQTPHTHIFSRNRRQFADKGLESDFCRKPDTDNIPWCYTTAQRPVFEACDIPKCTNGGLPKHFTEFGETVGDKKVSRKFGEIGRIKFSANFSMVKANYTNAAVFENGVIVLGKDEDSIKNIKLAKNKGLTFTSNTESKSGSTAVIAPFWTEIHRNQSIGSNYVFFRESTEPDVMIPLGNDVTSKLRFLNRKKPRDEMFVPKWALIVTWYLVGDNSSVTDVKNLNSFQAILTTDGNRSFVLLNYDMRKWSEKKNTALIGYKSGNAMSFLNHSLPYTNKLQFETASRLGRAVTTQSNVGKAGQMMYEISICNKLLPDGSKPKKCSDSLTLRLKTAPSTPTNCQGKNCTGNRTCDSKTGDCVCPAGYTGSQCEINIDDCQQNPCQNGGTCTDATNGYYCTCRPGYTGSRCEANVNECFKSPCLNNGTCVDGENSYRCICTPEYKGVNCETLKDQCKSNPCMNGAKCTTTEDNFVCNCAEEFSGKQCQYRYCFDGSCIKSHTCQDRTTGKENCTCRADAPSNGYCQEVPSLPGEFHSTWNNLFSTILKPIQSFLSAVTNTGKVSLDSVKKLRTTGERSKKTAFHSLPYINNKKLKVDVVSNNHDDFILRSQNYVTKLDNTNKFLRRKRSTITCQALTTETECKNGLSQYESYGSIGLPYSALSAKYNTQVSAKGTIDFYNAYRNCHPYFLYFACASTLPKCTENPTTIILPCRDFCEMVKSDCKDELDMHKPDTSWDANFPCNSYPENTTECVGPPTLKTTTTQPTTSANVETTSQSRTESLTLETSTTDKTEPLTVRNLETSTGTKDVLSTSTELVDITEVTTTATSGEQMTTKIETSTATSGDQNTTKMDSSTATSDDQTSEIVDTSTADLTTDTAEKSTTTDGSTASPFLATTEGSITSNAIQMLSTEASTTSKSITSAQTDTTITNQYTEAMKTDEITTEPIVEISLTTSTTATPTMIETTNLENAGVSTATSRPEMTESDIATPTSLSATPGILVTTTKKFISTGIVDTTTGSTVPLVATSTTAVTSQTPTAGTTSENLSQTPIESTSVSTTQLPITNEKTTIVTSSPTTVESTEDTNLTTELASTVATTTDLTTVVSEITTLTKTSSPEPTTVKDLTTVSSTTNPSTTMIETTSSTIPSPTTVTSSVTTHTTSLSTVQLTTTDGMISSTAPIVGTTYTASSPTAESSNVGEINKKSTGIKTTSPLETTEIQTTTRSTVEQSSSSPATNISVTEEVTREAPTTAPFPTHTSAISQEILTVRTSADVIEGQTTEKPEESTISTDSKSVTAEITTAVTPTSTPFSTNTSAISQDILTVTSQTSSGVTEGQIMDVTETSTISVKSESTFNSVTQTTPNTFDIASTQQQSSNSEIMETTTTNQSEVEKQTLKPNDTISLPAITENTTLYSSSIATSSTSTTEEDIETSMATTSSIMNDIATFSRDDTQAITTANVEFLRTTSSGSQTTQTTPLVNETNEANDFSSTSLTGQTQTTKPLDTTSTNEMTSVFSGTEQMFLGTVDITGTQISAVFNTTAQSTVTANELSTSSTTKELQTDLAFNSSTTSGRNIESTTEESSTLSMVLSTTNKERETTGLQSEPTTGILLETTTFGPTSATIDPTTSLIPNGSGINTETGRFSTSTNSSSTIELISSLGYVSTAVSENRETVSTTEANTIGALVEMTTRSSGSSLSMFPTTTLFEALTQNSILSTLLPVTSSPSEVELTSTQNNITKFAELTTTTVEQTTDSSMTSETTLPQENATQANLEFTSLDNNSSQQLNTESDFASTITSVSNEIAQNSVTSTIFSGTTANPPIDLTSSQYNTMEVTDTTTSSLENTTNLVSASETGRAIIDSVTKLPEISTSTFVVTSQEQTSSKDSTEQSNAVEALVEETSRTTSTLANSETIFASTEQSSSATSSFSIQTTSISDTTEVVELSTTENIQITVTQAIGTEAFIDTNSTVISDITIRTTNTVSIIPETMESDNTTIIDVVLQSTTTVPTVSDRSTIESTSMAATNSLQVDNSTSDVPFTSMAESTSNVFATSGTDIAPTSTVIPSTLPSSSELPLEQNSTSANTTVVANDMSSLGGSRPIEITSESNSVGTWTDFTNSSPIAQTTESQLSVSQPISSSVPVRNNTELPKYVHQNGAQPEHEDVTPRQNTVKYQQTNGGQKDTQTHHNSFHSLNVNTTTYVKSLLASTLYHFTEHTSLVPLATTHHPISVESQTTSNVFETSADRQDGEFFTIIAKVSENTTVRMSMLTKGLKRSQVHEDTSPTDASEASSNTEAVRRLDANLTSTFSLPLDDTTRVSDFASSDTSLPKTGGSFVATSKSKEINSTRTVRVSPTFQFSSYDAPTQQNNTEVTYSSKDSSIDWQSRKYFSKNSLQKSLSILKSEPVTTKTLVNKTHSNHSTISSDANVALSSTHSFNAFSSIILSRISSVSPFRSSKSPALKFTSKSPPSSHSPIKSSTSESFHSLSSSTSNHNLVTSSTTRSLSPSSPSRVYASSLPGSPSVSSSFTSPSQGIVRLVSDSNYTSNDFVSTTSPFITSIIVNNGSSISPNSAPITESTIVNFEETSSTQSTIPSASSIEDSTSQETAFETATRLSLRTSETSTRNDTDATNINVEQTSSTNEAPTMELANLSAQSITRTDAPNTDTVRALPTNEAITTVVSTNAISTRRKTTVTRSTSYKTTGTTERNSFITSTVIASSNPSVIVEKVSGVPTTVRIEGLEGATSISTTTASTDFDDILSFPNSNKTDNITETTSSYDSTPDASTYFENEQYTSEEPPVTTINGLFTTLPVSTAAQTSPGKSSGTSMQTKMASPVESTTPATVLTSQKTIFLSTDSMDKWMLSTTNSVTQPITTSVASTDATSATITSVGSTTSVGLTTPLTVMTSQDTMLFNTGPGDESILSTTNSITEPITTSSTLSSATSTSATAFTNIVSQSTTTQSDSNTRNESNLAETTVSSTALLTDEITQEVTVTQQVPTSTTSDVTSIDETQTANLEYPSTTISFNEIPSSSVINGIRTPTATSSISEQTSQSTRETTMPTETTIISTTQTSSKAVTQSQQQTTGYTQSIASSTVSEILLNETSTSQNSFVTSATTSTAGIETLTPSESSAGSNFENSISTDSTATVFEIETTSTNTFQTTETLLATTNVLTETTPNASACSSEKTGTDPSGYILWPTTNSGSVAVSSCPTPTSKTATRVCNSSNWGAPDTSACTQLSPRSRELQDLDRTTIVAGNAATLANQILNVTSNEKDSLVAYDLQLVSNILLKVVDVIGEENNYDITSDVINSVSNVIEAPSEELRVASQEFSSNSRLVQVIDNVLLKLEVLTDQNVYLNSKNVKVAVAGISGNETFTGKSFTLSSNLQPGISDGTDSGGNSGQASVFIPPSVTEKVTSTSFTRIQFAVYTSTALFNHVRVDDGTVPGLGSNMNVSVFSDHVVSASIGNTKITGLSENVTITISRSNSYYGKGPHCVFYNFPNNGGEGSWSAEGCHLNPESTSTTTICDCNHLTNFAVIMDVYGTVEYFNEYQNMILQILTYIGCSLSIFGLLCTLISYLMFEKLRKEVPAKILICLCAALITVNIVYLCLQSAYYSSHTTCVAIAAIMHYALLSSLMWMGLEAINMYIALVKVFNTYYRKYMLKMSLAGWGVPLLIVLIAFIVQFATGIPSYEMNSKTEICWLRRDVFYGTLVAPFAIVFLLNSVIYCLVLAQLLGMSSRKLKHLDSARKLKKPAKRENFRKLRGAIGLMALLGISWGFALGTFDKAALTFAYVFVVFNSSQGFWVFIFHCVLKKEVSKCWKKLVFNKGTFRDGSSRWSRFSSSNTRGSRSTTTSSARSMSASSIRTSYLVPKPSKSVDRSEASIGMDSKGLDVVTRTNSTANPVFDDPDIGPPPPFPPPPIPTEERIVRRVPRRTSPQPSTTISTQTDVNLLHSSDTDSQNSMESMENSRQDEQNMEDEERRDSVNNNFGLPGIQGFQFPDHREVVISPSNESGIYSDASVSSTAILVEMPTYMDLESNNNEVSALRNNDVSRHHSGEINLGYEDDTLDDVTILSNDVTLINSGANDNVDIVEKHGGVNNGPHQRYAVKETKPDSTSGTPRIKGTNSLTDDARNTDSGISISSDATGAGSSTAGSTRSERPELVTQDSRSSLYSVNSNTSSASGPSSGSESSYQIGRVRDRQSSGDLPSPHLWKAPLVIKRSDDHTKANKKEGIFRRKPVITGPNDNSSTKRALWKRSRNNSKDNSTEKQSMTSFPPKRKLKRQPNKSENCDKSEGATNKLDIQMTNFSLNRGSFHDGAL